MLRHLYRRSISSFCSCDIPFLCLCLYVCCADVLPSSSFFNRLGMDASLHFSVYFKLASKQHTHFSTTTNLCRKEDRNKTKCVCTLSSLALCLCTKFGKQKRTWGKSWKNTMKSAKLIYVFLLSIKMAQFLLVYRNRLFSFCRMIQSGTNSNRKVHFQCSALKKLQISDEIEYKFVSTRWLLFSLLRLM